MIECGYSMETCANVCMPMQVIGDACWAQRCKNDRESISIKQEIRDGRLLCWGLRSNENYNDEPVSIDSQTVVQVRIQTAARYGRPDLTATRPRLGNGGGDD